MPPGGNYWVDGKRVILTADEPYILSEFNGVGGAEASVISSTIPGMDGAAFQTVRIEPREISCTVYVRGKDRQDMYAQRYNLIRLLTPSNSLGWLYYANDYIRVRTQALPRLPPDFTERIRNYNKAEIAFWCPSPHWQSTITCKETIGYVSGTGFGFPFSFPIEFAGFKNEVTIDYQGSAPAPVTITINGPATAPKIVNTKTNQYIALTNQPLTENQVLRIVTTRGSKSVRISEVGKATKNAFQYIDPSSVFWELHPGANRITYDSGGSNEPTAITIVYTERYSGV